MQCNKLILQSDSKVTAVWKIAKKGTGRYFSKEYTPLIKINNNVIKNPKLRANSLIIYFLTVM